MTSGRHIGKQWTHKIQPYLPLALFVLVIPLYWIGVCTPSVGFFHDDGIYLVTAKSLAEGQGYRIISLPDKPPETLYPVLYPLILAAAWHILPPFPGNLLGLKLLSSILTAFWLSLSYRLVTRYMGIPPLAALWMSVITLLVPSCIVAGTTILSEAAFGALLIGTLLVLSRIENKPTSNWVPVMLAALLAAATYQVRTAGIVLLPSGAVGLLISRRAKAAALYSVPVIAVAAAWSVWQRYSTPVYTTTAQAYYTAVSLREFSPVFAEHPFQATVRVALANAIALFAIPLSSFDLQAGILILFVTTAIGAFVWLAVLVGLLRCKTRSITVLALLYVTMVLVWAWPPGRFILPVLPIFMACAYLGTPQRWRAPLALAFFLALMPGITRFVRYTPAKQTVVFDAASPDWSATSRMYFWISQNTEPSSVVAGPLDPGIYLFTGHPSIRPYRTEPMIWPGHQFLSATQKTAEFKVILRAYNIGYYAEDGDRSFEDPDYATIMQALQKDGTLSVIREFDPTTRIYRVNHITAEH